MGGVSSVMIYRIARRPEPMLPRNAALLSIAFRPSHPLRQQKYPRMISVRFARTAIFLVVLSGCSTVPRIVNEYKIDVQQGNVLTQEMVAQLRPGLTKDQVRFVLGTPMLMDMFHAERWDYVYRLRNGATGDVEMRKFSVFFD